MLTESHHSDACIVAKEALEMSNLAYRQSGNSAESAGPWLGPARMGSFWLPWKRKAADPPLIRHIAKLKLQPYRYTK